MWEAHMKTTSWKRMTQILQNRSDSFRQLEEKQSGDHKEKVKTSLQQSEVQILIL
jgi:hypothetical protein